MDDLKQMLDDNCRKYPAGPMADLDSKVRSRHLILIARSRDPSKGQAWQEVAQRPSLDSTRHDHMSGFVPQRDAYLP